MEQFLLFRSEAAFNRLYKNHSGVLYKMALQISDGDTDTAADLVQNTWLKAIQKLEQFRWESSLRTWLIGILIFSGKEYMRKAERLNRLPQADGETFYYTRYNTELDLERALQELPNGYRVILVLHDLEGYKHEEIGKMLGINPGTSKSQLFNARKMMRSLLNN